MKQATENADRADDSPRHNRCRQSRQGIDSRRGQSEPRKTQIEQIINRGIADVNRANKA